MCPAGNPCTTTAECATGNVCDPKAKLCLVSSCAGGDLQNEADLKRVRYCQHVSGSLTMAYVAGSPATALDLRYLKTVTGSLSLSGAALTSLRLDALESVGADLAIAMVDTELLHAPELVSVAGSVTVGFGSFTSVQLPKLRSVGKDLHLQYLNYANTINIAALSTVGGTVFVSRLPLVPWSSLLHLLPQGASSSVSEIGCNVCPDNPSNRYMCSSGAGC